MTDWHAVQRRLRDLGFDPGPLDGIRGPKTDAAIVAFKKSIGFRARPYYGPLTEAALFAGLRREASGSASQMPWMDVARDVLGLHEQRDTGRLRQWFDASVAWIDPREIPWCGAFVATCYRQWQPGIDLPDNPLGARNWMRFGQATGPQLGACLVFWRGSKAGWKGHVGFYYGEDGTHFHVLGGNQSNAVTVTRVAKARLLGARWPLGRPQPKKIIHLSPSGAPVTTNEA